MKFSSSLSLKILFFTASLSSTPTALPESTTIHSKYVGTYLSGPIDDRRAGPSMDVSLGADGSATLTEDPGNGITTLFGHWIDSGSQVRVTFDAVEGRPVEAPMVFQPAHDGLQAVTWNHATWGKMNPPPMKNKSRVKERFTHNRSTGSSAP